MGRLERLLFLALLRLWLPAPVARLLSARIARLNGVRLRGLDDRHPLFMRCGPVIPTAINSLTFDGATKDPMQSWW
jgi:hypothetical protein